MKSGLSTFKVRRSIAKLVAAGKEFIFFLDELEHWIGYDSTYKRFHRIMRGMVDRGELIKRNKFSYQLTAQGRIKTLPVIKPYLAKDGKIRILMFDVPESRRINRDKFRRHLKALGFKLHQKSVWVSPYKCEKWLLELARYHGLEDCVSLYIGTLVL